MLIDTHCHLNFKAFTEDVNNVINKAKEAGVDKIIIPGAKLDSSEKAIVMAEKFNCCYAAVGIHPHHSDELMSIGSETIIKRLSGLLKNNRAVAIGEIGMDYHQYKDHPVIDSQTKILQKELFKLQLNLAIENKLPVILHCRQAHDDLLLILNEDKYNGFLKGVFHCFDGSPEHLQSVLELGFYIGFDGNITYPENERLWRLAEAVPPEKLLIETDSPYLTPVPYRGTRNEPRYLSYTLEKISLIKNIGKSQLEEITYNNALKLFSL